MRWIGRRLRLFENRESVIEAVDEASWHGVCEPPTDRIVRRAQLHRQLLRTRPRHFKSIEGGILVTMRMLQAAAADLGGAWASALFLCAEREFWASRCEAACLRSRSQSHLGLGWSNVAYHSYDCSRTYLHLYARLFEALGFRRRDATLKEPSDNSTPELPSRAALVMEHQTSRAIVLLKADATATDPDEDFGRVRLSPATRHGHSGLWCALHGESILEGGMSHIAARYDEAAVRGLLGQEGVELLPPHAGDSFALQLTKGDRRAVDPRRVYVLERRGYIGRDLGEEFRLNGAIATHFAMIGRNGSMPCLPCSPETSLACDRVEKPRQERHRCRPTPASRSRRAMQSQ